MKPDRIRTLPVFRDVKNRCDACRWWFDGACVKWGVSKSAAAAACLHGRAR